MRTGDIILIPFPFAESNRVKARPAVLISKTADLCMDFVLAAISCVIPKQLSRNEMIIYPDSINNLRAVSVIKIDRIVTLKANSVIARLGQLKKDELIVFKRKFRELVE
ncbi:type II toxin-antitoxin system PemK/MazF family toxin [Roseimarinus sediminis]|uniref:type II toxin-antitoxin system PemK/MazF family toxin n=1 Tax=Roseimarinus sediminis TaxID=1610899 RepID=UPI003D20DA04